jgi:two-component system sensor histidine kinase KdpD
MPVDRPDPDQLLADVTAQEAAASRGRLRIYFGASAGVGKTYTMLSAAHALRESGADVVAGVVETHGRRETEALLKGIEILPPRTEVVNGREMREFDLDAALARKPALLLVDELAHSNLAGSRHAKRWQDIEELVAAGIDVYTTLNVQHLESLNDVVGGITGVRVWETVPDTFFDAADEVIVVDLTADELLNRLAAGKVYLPEQIERAAQNFFRKGNLMALRELALRRTADRIEEDVQAYRIRRAIEPVWKTEASLVCGVGPQSDGEGIVRNAARLAAQLGVDWTAVYVETPRLQRLPSPVREKILRTLKLAQELGARTAVLSGVDAAQVIIDYARTHNCSKVVLGRPRSLRSRWLGMPLVTRIGALAADLDVIAVGRAGTDAGSEARAPQPRLVDTDERHRKRWRAYGLTVLAVASAAAIASVALPYFDLANIVMMFLLAIVLVAVRLGRGPAVMASFLSVAVFDFFFVPPRFSFAVSDVQYLLTFVVMLAVALVIGNLTAGLRFQAKVATFREERSRAVSEFARELSSLLDTPRVVEIATEFIEAQFRGTAAVLPLDSHDALDSRALERVEGSEPGTARWALDNAKPAGLGTDTLAGSRCLYLPLIAPMRTRGVLVLHPASSRSLMIPEQRRQLETFAFLTALSLERVHYVEVAQQALLRMESERLRNSLLAALSHDLRTPLTSLVGLAQSLATSHPPLAASQQEIALSLVEQSQRLASLVANLLDMARIETGDTTLRRTWQPIEEVIGSAIAAARSALGTRHVEVAVANDAPLVEIDSVLIERVLYNLLENAGKYTPAGTPVRITATVDGDQLRVAVTDRGPGVPKGQEAAIFEKFTRGVGRESNTPGVGLGLAIARAIVEAHGGRIYATAAPEGGATFVFTFPLGVPPAAPPESELATDSQAGPTLP